MKEEYDANSLRTEVENMWQDFRDLQQGLGGLTNEALLSFIWIAAHDGENVNDLKSFSAAAMCPLIMIIAEQEKRIQQLEKQLSIRH